jgi:hypothetical protein
MRTTLTLDDDVAVKLQQLARRSGASFKETVNVTLRRALAAQERRAVRPQPFRVDTFNSPFRPGVDPLRLNQLLVGHFARRKHCRKDRPLTRARVEWAISTARMTE